MALPPKAETCSKARKANQQKVMNISNLLLNVPNLLQKKACSPNPTKKPLNPAKRKTSLLLLTVLLSINEIPELAKNT
jgi:hypothetical protein